MRRTQSHFYHTPAVLVISCELTKHPKLSDGKQNHITYSQILWVRICMRYNTDELSLFCDVWGLSWGKDYDFWECLKQQGAGIIWSFLYSVWHLGWDDLKSGLCWGCQPEHLDVALHVVWLFTAWYWVLQHPEIVGSEYCTELHRSCKISFNLELEVTSITSLYSVGYKRVFKAHPGSKGEKLDPTS